jgi:ABC-type phosphate transport system substrate-binding protein
MRMAIWRLVLGFTVAIATICPAQPASADIAIIVSKNNSVMQLTESQVADIFLGRTATFPNGGIAVPLDQVEGSPVRDEFYAKIVRKSAAQLKAHWMKRVFAGKGEPPKEAASSEAVKRQVADDPYAVGYINANMVDGTVRALLVIR